MSNLLGWVLEDDLEKDSLVLESVLDYLKEHCEQPFRLLETQEGYHALTYFCLFAYCHRQSLEDEDIDKVLLQKDEKLYDRFWLIFKQLFETRRDWIHAANRQFDPEEIREDTTLEERKQFVFCSYLQLLMCLLPISNDFYALSNRAETISVLVGTVADEHILEKLDEFTLDVLIINISNLSNYADSIKSDWQQLKCVPILINFLSKHPSFYIFIYETVLNVASEKEIEELGNINEIISRFLSIFHGKNFSETHREKFFDDELNMYVETEVGALYYEEKECTIAITDFMRVLYRLSVNDSIKLSFYRQIKEDLLKEFILKSHNEVVRQYAVQILAQLCFNKQVLEDVIKEKELVECIARLSKDESIVWKRLKKNCQQIVWLIQNHSSNKQFEKVKSQYEFDFMLSYNNESRDLCLKVKRSLEANGFKVWMNLDHIHGSSVESMTKKVESSKCVLICVTEKYKQCISCRFEAEYAFKHNKWIIPLVMQIGYDQVDGWLGLIIGSKVFIEFCTTEYDKSFEELMRNINLNITALKTEVKNSTTDLSSQNQTPNDIKVTMSTTKILTEQNEDVASEKGKTKLDEIESWTSTQVDDWLASQNTHESIREYLRSCNGELLIQLHQLQMYSPQYFFQIISNIKCLSDPLSYLNFGVSLKRLFK